MHYALVAYDRPGGLADRTAARADHLKYLEALGEHLVLAGPFLNDRGEMCGSIVVIEAGSLDDARETFARDPYAAAGLFDSVTIKPWKLGVNKTRN